PARKYPARTDQLSMLRRIEERLNAVGAIEGASTSIAPPLSGGNTRKIVIDGRTADASENRSNVTMISVGPRYFDALGVRLVRGRSDAGPLTAQLRKEIFALEPDMPLANIRTMDQDLEQQRWDVRVVGTMFSVFAGIAIVLATVGLYAVTAYSVTQRTQEIG